MTRRPSCPTACATAHATHGARRGAGPAAGLTLLELLVTLALLGVLAGVVGLTMHTAPRLPTLDPLAAQVLAARDSAVHTGHPVTITLLRAGRTVGDATALPDGRVIADASVDASLAIDPLNGRVIDARP